MGYELCFPPGKIDEDLENIYCLGFIS